MVRPKMLISRLLQRFSQHAEAITPLPFMDERSRPLYLMMVSILVVEAFCFWLLELTVSIEYLFLSFFALIWMVCAAFLARRYGHPRIALMLEAVALPYLAGISTAVGSFLTTRISLPLADDLLEAADTAIGFDWVSVFSLYQDHPWLIDPSLFAYNSMVAQLYIVPLLLVISGNSQRAWIFLTALVIAGIATVIVHPFFPAAGPYLQYGLRPDDLPELSRTFPWTVGETIDRIRLGQVTDVTSAMSGLVSMPSFHAIAAVILAWGSYALRWARISFVLLNIGMWFATIVIGSHYFIDLLLGTFVAAAAVFAARRIVLRTEATRQTAAD